MPRFEIEKVFEIPARGWFVMARALDDVSAAGPGYLGDLAVDGGTVPRKTGARGEAREDIWIFRLARGSDPSPAAAGQVVDWSSREPAGG